MPIRVQGILDGAWNHSTGRPSVLASGPPRLFRDPQLTKLLRRARWLMLHMLPCPSRVHDLASENGSLLVSRLDAYAPHQLPPSLLCRSQWALLKLFGDCWFHTLRPPMRLMASCMLLPNGSQPTLPLPCGATHLISGIGS